MNRPYLSGRTSGSSSALPGRPLERQWRRSGQRRRPDAAARRTLQRRPDGAARQDAGGHACAQQVAAAKRLLRRLDENERVLLEACDMLTAAVKSRLRIAPAGEWLLDNFYLIEEQIRTARQHLPKGYSRELPRLAQGPSRGLPRVYDIALEAISHGDGRVDSRQPRPLRRGLPDGHAAHARRTVGDPDHAAPRADREPAPRRRPDHDGAGSTRARRSTGPTR